MYERSRKIERLELAQKYLSSLIALASFWLIAFYWNYYSIWNLEPVPRLGFAAAISWVVFLHAEVAGMLIMTAMKEKWREEAQEARERERDALEREREARERERDAVAQAQELREALRAMQTQAQAREAWDREREAREAAREEAREAREAARDAQMQEFMLGLMRTIDTSERGGNANGGNA